MNYKDVYEFWFVECTESDWWKKSADFDRIIKNRFGILHQMAHQGELSSWRATPLGALCEIIILDQFSRNIFRDTPEAFASDALALSLTQHAIEKGYHRQLNDTELMFLYLPMMHSESRIIIVPQIIIFATCPIMILKSRIKKLSIDLAVIPIEMKYSIAIQQKKKWTF